MKKLRQAFGSLKNLGQTSDPTDTSDGILHSPHRSLSASLLTTRQAEGSYLNIDDQSLRAESSVVNYINPLRNDDPLSSKLHKWAYFGNISKIKKFIKKCNVNAVDSEGRTSLHLCANEGHIDILLCLLCSGASSDFKDRDGRTPLLRATIKGHLGIVQMLLQHKADCNVKDNMNNTLLHTAAQVGSKDLTELFLDQGFDVETRNIYGQTALHLAACNVHIDVVKALLQVNINVNAEDKDGVTPLMMAVKKGCIPLVDILLQSGADLAQQDCSGWNAISYAKYSGYNELHHYLSNVVHKESSSSILVTENKPYMLGLGRKLSTDRPLYNSALPQEVSKSFSFENIPLNDVEDSWNDDSESYKETVKAKVIFDKFIIGDNFNSIIKCPNKGLSASMTSLAPPKPPRLFASTPNLTDESLTIGTNISRESNIEENIKLTQNLANNAEESKNTSNNSVDNELQYQETECMIINPNLEKGDNIEKCSQHSSPRNYILLDHAVSLTDEDISFEEDSDVLPSNEENLKGQNKIKKIDLSILELPMFKTNSPPTLQEEINDCSENVNNSTKIKPISSLLKNYNCTITQMSEEESSFPNYNIDCDIKINGDCEDDPLDIVKSLYSDSPEIDRPGYSKDKSLNNEMKINVSGNSDIYSPLPPVRRKKSNSKVFISSTQELSLVNIPRAITRNDESCSSYVESPSNNNVVLQIDFPSNVNMLNEEGNKKDEPHKLIKSLIPLELNSDLQGMAFSNATPIGTLGRFDTLQQVDEVWEANANLEKTKENFIESLESSESETFEEKYKDCNLKRVFFGDSNENVFSIDNKEKGKLRSIITANDINQIVPKNSSEKDASSKNKMLNYFLTLDSSQESKEENLISDYIKTAKLPTNYEELELLVRKLRILLYNEYIKIAYFNSNILDWKVKEKNLNRKIEKQEMDLFNIQREVLKLEFQLKTMENKCSTSVYEKKIALGSLDEALKKVISLEIEQEKLKLMVIEKNDFIDQLEMDRPIAAGKNLFASTNERVDHNTVRQEEVERNSQTDRPNLPKKCAGIQTNILDDVDFTINSIKNVHDASSQICAKAVENFAQTSLEEKEERYSQTDELLKKCSESQTNILNVHDFTISSINNVQDASSQSFVKVVENFAQTSLEEKEERYSQTDELPKICTGSQTNILDDHDFTISSIKNFQDAASQICAQKIEHFAQTSLEWNKNDLESSLDSHNQFSFLKNFENECGTINIYTQTEISVSEPTNLAELKVDLIHSYCQTDDNFSRVASQIDSDFHLNSSVNIETFNSCNQTDISSANREYILKVDKSNVATQTNLPEVTLKSATNIMKKTKSVNDKITVAIQSGSSLHSLQSCGTQVAVFVKDNSSQTSVFQLDNCNVGISTEAVDQINAVTQTDSEDKYRVDHINEETQTESEERKQNLLSLAEDIKESSEDLKDTILKSVVNSEDIKNHLSNELNCLKKSSDIELFAKFSDLEEVMSKKLEQLEFQMLNLGNNEVLSELKTHKNLLSEMSQCINNINRLESDLKLNSVTALDILNENQSQVCDIRLKTLDLPKELSKSLSLSMEKLNSILDDKMKEQIEMRKNDSNLLDRNITQLNSKLEVITKDCLTNDKGIKELCDNIQSLIDDETNKTILCKLSENEIDLKQRLQQLANALEEATTETNQVMTKNLKLLINNVDETVAENFQIVLNLLRNFEETLTFKVNEISKNNAEASSIEKKMLTKYFEDLQTTLSSFKTSFEVNSENAFSNIFEPSVMEAIRGGNDQALLSLRTQNEIVLKSIEECRNVLNKFITNQCENYLKEETSTLERQEEIKQLLSDKNAYIDKVNAIEIKWQDSHDNLIAKNNSENLRSLQLLESQINLLTHENKIIQDELLFTKKNYELLLQEKRAVISSLPIQNRGMQHQDQSNSSVFEGGHVETIESKTTAEFLNQNENFVNKTEILNLEKSLKQTKDENLLISLELKHVKEVYECQKKELLDRIDMLKNQNEANNSRICVLQKKLLQSELSSDNVNFLPENLEHHYFQEIHDLKISKNAVVNALQLKRNVIQELKLQISDLESEKEELKSDLFLKTSHVKNLKRDCSNHQRTLLELRQQLQDRSNDDNLSQEQEQKLSELQGEISSKHSLILSLRERVAGLAQEKKKLVDQLSIQETECLNSEEIQKEKEAAVQASQKLRSQLETLSNNINEKFIPKAKLDAFYQDIESHFENLLAEKKLQWSSVFRDKLQAQEYKNQLLKDEETYLKQTLKNEQDQVALLKSKLALSDRNGLLWRSRYNQIFQEYFKISQVENISVSNVKGNIPLLHNFSKLESKNAFTSTHKETRFQDVLDEIDLLLKTPYEDSMILNISQSSSQAISSLPQSDSSSISYPYSATHFPNEKLSFLDKSISSKLAERDSGWESVSRGSNLSSKYKSFRSPTIHKSQESSWNFLQPK